MKNKCLFTYIGLVGLFLCSCTLSVLAQKKPLDINACSLWKRVDMPEISSTGRWVTYKLSLMEYTPDVKEDQHLYLFDTKTRKEYTLDGRIRQLRFYNKDRNAYYQLEDSTGKSRTYLLSLPSCALAEWKYKEDFRPVEGTPYSISTLSVPKDTLAKIPAFTRLVVRHLKTNDVFYIDSVGLYSLYDGGKSILFIRKRSAGNELCYGPLKGPYKTLYRSEIAKVPSSYRFNDKNKTGEFNIKDSLWYSFSLNEPACSLLFDCKEVSIPCGFTVTNVDMMKSRNYFVFELKAKENEAEVVNTKSSKRKDTSFDLEMWTWNEYEVPTLQSKREYNPDEAIKYVYDIKKKTFTQIAPSNTKMFLSSTMKEMSYALYIDKSPYKDQKEWLEDLPFDIYSVNIHTGEKQMIGKSYRDFPKWSPSGRWALVYDSNMQVWNSFDVTTGKLVDISSSIGYPIYNEMHDTPCPASPYGIAGWSADGDFVFIYDMYDWWKVDLSGYKEPQCLTKGFGRKNKIVIRKKSSNIDKVILDDDEILVVSLWNTENMNEGLYHLDMSGRLKKLTEGPYNYNIHRFSKNHKFCLWSKQNLNEFRDLWWSKADFSNPIKVTEANPQQKNYKWGNVKVIKWINYENKENKGLLYLPEDFDPKKEYPVLVQFYETHSGSLNAYQAPMLSSAMGDVMYFVSNGYIVFMPDVHYTIGTPGKSCYDAVVSGTKYLIEKGIAHPGKIGLQGHSWSGFQTSYLVTQTNIFTCANIAAPITDMITGYLSLRNGSGLPRYFMYEETQSRMGKSIWKAKEQYMTNSVLLEADKITTPLLILHNDQDEAVPYEQGRALYLAMRRLQRPAWLLNYKGEGHFILGKGAQKDWTIRMMQFFDYYLKGTDKPRWMEEGIHLRERGIEQKYDLIKK